MVIATWVGSLSRHIMAQHGKNCPPPNPQQTGFKNASFQEMDLNLKELGSGGVFETVLSQIPQWFAMRMYSESPGPSGCNVGYAAPSYVGPREDLSTFERFLFSWILLCHGMREAVLFFVCNLIVWICPTVSCIFVLVPWWVVRSIQFFRVFINQVRMCGWCEGFSSWVQDRNSHDTLDARNPAGPGTSQTL